MNVAVWKNSKKSIAYVKEALKKNDWQNKIEKTEFQMMFNNSLKVKWKYH